MIAFIIATIDEAEPLLGLLKAEVRLTQPFPTYGFQAQAGRPAGIVIICGMGPEPAATATRYAILQRGAKTIINMGICGSLNDTLKPGDQCRVIATSDGDAFLRENHEPALHLPDPETWPEWKPARLTSLKEPVFGGGPRARLSTIADIVDMEGHAIARVAREYGIPCTLLKGVSDFANPTGREDLHRNLTAVSSALAQAVVPNLGQFCPAKRSLLRRMADFVKVEHTLFSLPFLFAGAWIGAGYQWPGLKRLLLIALAGLGARTLGMAMNRILDQRLDLMNPRTANRDLPSGKLSPAQAWTVAVTGLCLYLIACAALGPVCLRLSPIPAFVLISYSLLKRFTNLCHFGIGLSLALGTIGAHVAVTGNTTVSPAIVLLTLFTFCWISASDILYALQDMESDRENGIHSIPASFGPMGARVMAAVIHGITLLCAYLLWWITGAGLAAGLALAVTGLALIMMYNERLSLAFRFFPVSAIASIAGALIPLLKK